MSSGNVHTNKSNPLVSVIMIFLNTGKFIEEAITSVLNQTCTDWELLLVDDGSTDESTRIARSFVDRSPDKIFYFEHQNHSNRGMSASRNLAIQNARGKYIAFLDADDVYNVKKLEEQTRVLETHPDAAFACGRTERWHSWAGNKEDRDRDTYQNFTVPFDTLLAPPVILLMWLKDEYAALTADVMVRRDIVNTVGGYEDAFRGMYEDQVFHAKLCLRYHGYISSASWYRYRQHPASMCSAVGVQGWAVTRLQFLQWLKSYMIASDIHDEDVSLLMQQQLKTIWHARHPTASRIVQALRRGKNAIGSLIGAKQ
ncbi:MAG: glycosyltransferase family 2 protein [Bacteroidetes bacterium]|nr:glycosyltransferase family 2 protein [Bacteroidota bacterium]MCW5894548.1 glycosyltransferase family 2 protein [Bacteroidota bacterium]